MIQVDFVENISTKINCLGESVYWAYNRVTLCTACVWKHGGTHSIVIVSDYLQYGKYAANVFLKNHSATSRFNCPPVSGSCHSYFQMVLQVNLNWAYCCLALHSLEEMVCMTSLPPVIAKVLWMVLEEQ